MTEASCTNSLLSMTHFLPVPTPRKPTPSAKSSGTMVPTMDEKKRMMATETASIRSTSTMGSLKSLLPKKKNKKAADVDQERKARAEATKHEARAVYFAIR
jgi:hypothetical protein